MNHAFALILSVLALLAQQPATIHGVLTDASDSVIPAATVSLSGANVQKTARTSADGSYSFQDLTDGEYTLRVDDPNLEEFEKRVTVAAGKTLQVSIQLRLRVLTQPVTVNEGRGAELSLDSEDSVAVLVLKDSDLDALPDNPDDLLDMLQTLAGPAGGAGGPQISVDNFSGGRLPPKNTIKEIKINPDPFSAANEYLGFGRIEIVTKPGVDKFHGSAGITESDAAFNSRNPYAENKADYLNRTFTANFGDAINNRASYLFDFFRSTINNTALIHAVTLDPTTLAETPVRSTVVVPRDDFSGTARIDYQISTNHTLTGSTRYFRSRRQNNGVGQYSLESRGYPSKSATTEARFAETAVLSSSVVTETRVGYTRVQNDQYGDTSTPSLIVSSAFNGGSSQTGRTSNSNTLVELQSNTTAVHDLHTIRFGGRFRHTGITDISPSNFGGTFWFFGLPSGPVLDANNQPVENETVPISSLEQYRRTLLFNGLGYPASLIRSLGGGASQFSIAAGNPLVRFNQRDLAIYVSDDLRARPNLTISFGLRYETQTILQGSRDFAPRVSLAWSPGLRDGGSPKTVFRLGWGPFYNRIDPGLSQQTLRFNGVTQQQYVTQNPDFYPTAPATGSLAAGQLLTTYRLDPHLQASPWTYTAVTMERQLPGKTSLSATYRYQRTTHIVQTVNINAPLPGTFIGQGGGIRPYGAAAGNIFQFESGGIQKMKWLVVQVDNKLNPKISLTAQYTLMDAHNSGGWTDSGRWENAMPSNPYNFREDWGPAGWAAKHGFVLFGALTAPGGIQVSPFFGAASGQPYDLTIGSDRNGDTVPNDRPAFATDLSRPSVVITKFGAFDTNPLPGQAIVPRNYLRSAAIVNVNMRVSKTFAIGSAPETPSAGTRGPAQRRYGLNLSVDVNNVLNHVNQSGFVGNLASPLFGRSTAIRLNRDTSNNRRIQFGAQLTF